MDNGELKAIYGILACFYCTFGPDSLRCSGQALIQKYQTCLPAGRKSRQKNPSPRKPAALPGFLSGLRSLRY
jgi:hypothetical protein